MTFGLGAWRSACRSREIGPAQRLASSEPKGSQPENDLELATDSFDASGVTVLRGGKDQLTFALDSQQPGEAPHVVANVELLAEGLHGRDTDTAQMHIGMPSRADDFAVTCAGWGAQLPVVLRDRTQIRALLDGFELVPPGLVDPAHWPVPSPGVEPVGAYAAVGRAPARG